MDYMQGFIYKITCLDNNKSYIGQVKEYKYKNGKPYKYGVEGRWSDHVSQSKKSKSVFYSDIQKYGQDRFMKEILEHLPISELDAAEAEYILKENTVIPNGYNRMRHSQVKNRDKTNINTFFEKYAIHAKLSPIRRNGSYHLVYVTITMNNDEKRRVVFGQNKNETYAIARQKALTFIETLNCPYEEDLSYSEYLEERYLKKAESFKNEVITEIRITTASKLIAVYIKTDKITCWRDQTRICFGGKNITFENSYKIALEFIKLLPLQNNTIIHDTINPTIQSSQQATAYKVEEMPYEENSVNSS